MYDFRKFFIDGAWVAPAGRSEHDVINPATEEVVGKILLGTAEDVGATVADMRAIAGATSYVAGLPKEAGQAGGDPSPVTALGIFVSIEALLGGSVQGRTIAVQGVGSVGGRGENSSGDIFIAFSTANAAEASKDDGVSNLQMLPNERINPLFWATVLATEEAIINAMVAAETMKGYKGNTAYALPHDRLRDVLKKYGRLRDTTKK